MGLAGRILRTGDAVRLPGGHVLSTLLAGEIAARANARHGRPHTKIEWSVSVGLSVVGEALPVDDDAGFIASPVVVRMRSRVGLRCCSTCDTTGPKDRSLKRG